MFTLNLLLRDSSSSPSYLGSFSLAFFHFFFSQGEDGAGIWFACRGVKPESMSSMDAAGVQIVVTYIINVRKEDICLPRPFGWYFMCFLFMAEVRFLEGFQPSDPFMSLAYPSLSVPYLRIKICVTSIPAPKSYRG